MQVPVPSLGHTDIMQKRLQMLWNSSHLSTSMVFWSPDVLKAQFRIRHKPGGGAVK